MCGGEEAGALRLKGGKMQWCAKQWCGTCAKEQAGEMVLIGAKMCEACGKKRARHGLPDVHRGHEAVVRRVRSRSRSRSRC